MIHTRCSDDAASDRLIEVQGELVGRRIPGCDHVIARRRGVAGRGLNLNRVGAVGRQQHSVERNDSA